jgi:hypothetical protein
MERFRETPADTVLRTQMDTGPAKLRQRTTAGVAKLSLSYVLSAEQAQDLEDFYEDDLAGGALAFSFTHPRKGVTVSCRFTRPPEFSAAGNGFMGAVLELEVLP